MTDRRVRRILLGAYIAIGYALFVGLWWWRPPTGCPVTRMLAFERCPDGRLVSFLYGAAAMGGAALIVIGAHSVRRWFAGRSVRNV
ncbi:hypothetical protein AB0B94_31280 [Micromonospora sp. NPDC048986]|uniref:hypothetical protein n=1 Tax=Micromonospora sp. NPDC048986 TaxID=3155644 RepID=UPI0033FD7D79